MLCRQLARPQSRQGAQRLQGVVLASIRQFDFINSNRHLSRAFDMSHPTGWAAERGGTRCSLALGNKARRPGYKARALGTSTSGAGGHPEH